MNSTTTPSKLTILPAAKTACPICAVNPTHGPLEAHNQGSLFYQMRFHMTHGRSPTWSDAMAHIPPRRQIHWKETLARRFNYSGKNDPQPIAEAIPWTAESVNRWLLAVEPQAGAIFQNNPQALWNAWQGFLSAGYAKHYTQTLFTPYTLTAPTVSEFLQALTTASNALTTELERIYRKAGP